MSVQDLNQIIQGLYNSILPTCNEVYDIIYQSRQALFYEPNLLLLTNEINIVGDIHGQFYDLLNIFKIGGCPSKQKYLFLGDYVDRGLNSLETLLTLLVLKILYPENLYLLRGNHESFELTKIYGFKEECIKKYNLSIYLDFCQLFNYLPICALINENVFCVHGGIIPSIQSITKINDLDRFMKSDIHEMMWSDPHICDGYLKNPRGAGFLFGEDAVKLFMECNNLDLIVRSHQLVMEGYMFMFNKKVVTIWGAPNYCYKCENMACIMKFDKNGNYKFIIFDKVEDQFKLDLF